MVIAQLSAVAQLRVNQFMPAVATLRRCGSELGISLAAPLQANRFEPIKPGAVTMEINFIVELSPDGASFLVTLPRTMAGEHIAFGWS